MMSSVAVFNAAVRLKSCKW